MEESKYYVPELSEFYTGFEYQDHFNDKWNDMVFGPFPGSPDGAMEYIEARLSSTRVKYLDREDIESLGWEITHVSMGDVRWYRNKDGIQLSFDGSESRICIIADPYYCLFYGIIKNKSELRRLMKQLGI